ncbi:MAG: EpsI family protein, partial [Desulfosarcina sp.]|nr:EpsI family protein [Desulfobacterales bacterium]
MINTKKIGYTALLFLACTITAGAFALQYHQAIAALLSKWNTDDFSYCYVVPFIVIYLVYTKWPYLKAAGTSSPVSAFLVLILSGCIFTAGKLGSVETFVFASIWVAITGLLLLLAGSKIIKEFAFPLFILIFIVPLPPFLNNLFTFNLKLYSSKLAVEMMRQVGLSVFLEGNVIDLWVTKLQVVDACSGLRYVYPLMLMAFVFAYLFHKKWWERIIIILAAVPISVFSNALRIAVMGYLTIKVSPKIAESFFHGFSGWLIFMVSFVFLAFLSKILKIINKKIINKGEEPETEQKNKVPVKLKKIKISYLLITACIFICFWGLNSYLGTAMITPERKTFESFPTAFGDWQGEKIYLKDNILKSLWSDDYVQILFKNKKTGDNIYIMVPFYKYQTTRHTVHSPVSCLVGGGYAPLSRKIITKEFPEPFGTVKIRQMYLAKNDRKLLVNYWFQQRGRIIV